MFCRIHKQFFVVVALCGSGIASQAQTTPYTDKTSFVAASANLSTIDFAAANSNGVGTFTAYNDASGLTLQGVNFVGAVSNGSYRLYAVDPGYYSAYSG